ncbi:MAG: hypothetical protein JXB39_12015 [Deltaproteobacteria bacterium]|nr:hypothetical protein [Deltaproteobacteria bacterium]
MTAFLLTALWLHTTVAPVEAATCNVRDLRKKIAEAAPRETPALYNELLKCDARAAVEVAPEAFQKMIPGKDTWEASIASIQAGIAKPVQDWIGSLMTDERAETLAVLGERCHENPAVVRFFVDAKSTLGDRFWLDRWHRGLVDCREPEIQDLLRMSFEEETVQRDSSRFGSVLEVYSRNARQEAIPRIKALVSTAREGNQLHLIGAFADAAGVGSLEGTNPEAAKEAVLAIQELAPTLSSKVLEQARTTLQALGDADASNRLVAVRYADRRQPDGRFLWGAVAVETVLCKNGKTQIGIHWAPVYEGGHRWPDQMQAAVDEAVRSGWKLNLAKKCKGQGRVEVLLPSEPFVDPLAFAQWKEETVKDVKRRVSDRTYTFEEDAPVLP